MEDLKRLNWTAASSTANARPTVIANYCPAIQSTSTCSNITNSRPISNQSSGFRGSVPNSVARNTTTDSFSNLVSFGSIKATTLTLQQQQQKIEAEKAKQEGESRRQFDLQFGSGQFWDEVGTNNFASTKTIPATPQNTILPIGLSNSRSISPPAANGSAVVGSGADEDLFAAFNSETIVDGSSHYPPPPDLSNPQAWESQGISTSIVFCDNDDPFGLNEVKSGTSLPSLQTATKNYEDVLGDLGKPVEEIRRQQIPETELALVDQDLRNGKENSWEEAVEELMEMGFTAEQARDGLIESGSGLNIQAAVNYLLNNAHKQTYKEQCCGRKGGTRDISLEARDTSIKDSRKIECSPRIRDERSLYGPPKNSYPSSKSLDISRTASVVGNNLVKTANSFWMVSQKKVQKVVSDFRQDSSSDPNQPKWMQDTIHRDTTERISDNEGRMNGQQSQYVTDEALMLEGCNHPLNQTKARAFEDKNLGPGLSCNTSPVISKMTNKMSSLSYHQRQSHHEEKRFRKQPEIEQAYVSPARRKNPTPQSSENSDQKYNLTTSSSLSNNSPMVKKLPESTLVRTKPIPRNIPSVSLADLQSSHQYRLTGTSHFKRGDYASAHDSYSSSLDALPVSHPINIVLLCNRALTSLKTGVPQLAISDADRALKLIGVSRGDGETIDLGSGEGGGIKQMKLFYGKALLRKAEALEQMERWKDAGEVWKTCIEQGVGGLTASEGRTRCEKSLYSKKSSTDSRIVIPQNNVKTSLAIKKYSGSSSGESIAVKRLREANEKAEIVENQKLSLIDKVDVMIGLWRDGKRDNLRALIGSLDGIMWKESGWKSVGMHELVQNNKVKIHYMKAIAKTHPDKLPQDASIEVRMIASLVFATLNESWDKFKQQNQM